MSEAGAQSGIAAAEAALINATIAAGGGRRTCALITVSSLCGGRVQRRQGGQGRPERLTKR